MINTLRIIGLKISQVCLVLLLAAFILELVIPVSGQRGLVKVEPFDSPFIYRFGELYGFHNGQAFEKLGEFATRGSRLSN